MNENFELKGENGFPFYAECANCRHQIMQIDGALWCNVNDEIVALDDICENWDSE